MNNTRKAVFAGFLIPLVMILLLPTRILAASHGAPTTSQCTGSSIPDGWTITNHSTNWNLCGGNPWIVGNMESISPPPSTTDNTTICEDSPVPSGFVTIAQVTVSQLQTPLCETGNLLQRTGGLKTISPVLPTESKIRICASSPIPPNWVVFSTLPVPSSTPEDCQIDLQQGINQGQPSEQIEQLTGAPMTICSVSSTPVSYRTEELINDPACGPGLLNAAFIIPHSYDQGSIMPLFRSTQQ